MTIGKILKCVILKCVMWDQSPEDWAHLTEGAEDLKSVVSKSFSFSLMRSNMQRGIDI